MVQDERADAQANRETILQASCDLITAHGDFSMTDLSKLSGLSRMTVYRHFSDRNAVLDALVLRETTRLRSTVVDLAGSGDLSTAVDAYAEAVAELADGRREMLFAAAARVEHVARETLSDSFVAGMLAERRAAGEHHSPLRDGWLAVCMRSLSMAAVFDPRESAQVARDLSAALHQLLALPRAAAQQQPQPAAASR